MNNDVFLRIPYEINGFPTIFNIRITTYLPDLSRNVPVLISCVPTQIRAALSVQWIICLSDEISCATLHHKKRLDLAVSDKCRIHLCVILHSCYFHSQSNVETCQTNFPWMLGASVAQRDPISDKFQIYFRNIAGHIGIIPGTSDCYLSSLLQKMGIHFRFFLTNWTGSKRDTTGIWANWTGSLRDTKGIWANWTGSRKLGQTESCTWCVGPANRASQWH